MPRRRLPLLPFAPLLLALGTLSACLNQGASPMSAPESKPQIQIKERPNPQRAYRIEMRIENAPGPFGLVEGSAQYDVENHNECGWINEAVGVISRINTHPPIVWKPIGDNRYEAVVYVDLMLDEDYYGRGVCRWVFTEARARLKATGAEVETRFVPAISAEEITFGKAVTWYFPKLRYPVSGIPDFVEFGHQDPSKFKPEIRDELFSITLTPKDAQP